MRINLVQLVIKSLRFRKFTVGLTMFSLALSVMLLLGVDTIRVQAKENFINTISGTDLIVGSRSGSVQLLLYTVFHLGNPTNNVSWQSYNKIAKHPRIQWSIPISLGDSHRGFRVIGTSGDVFKFYRFGKSRNLEFLQGDEFKNHFDAVLGARVAEKLKYKLNDKIVLAHGMGNVSLTEHKNLPFTVTGILQATGTPIDESILISLSGLEAVHIGWEAGVASKQQITADELSDNDPRLQPKSITAFYLGLQSKHDVFNIQRAINDYKGEPLLAILPGIALLELWKVVGIIERVMLVIAAFVVATGLLGMLSIILTNLNERRREMAVLRSVGASPTTIFSLLLVESGLLVAVGILLGVLFLYITLVIMNPILHNAFGLSIELMPPTVFQWKLMLAIFLGGLLVALLPAINAYKKTLQDGLTIRT